MLLTPKYHVRNYQRQYLPLEGFYQSCVKLWSFHNVNVDTSDHVYYRWPRSTYRPTIDRHIGRLSVGNRPTIGRQSTDSRPIVDRKSTESRPTIDRQSTDSRPIVDRYIDRQSTNASPNMYTFIGRLSADIGRLSVDNRPTIVLLSLIRWIAIYPLDSVIHPLYNLNLYFTVFQRFIVSDEFRRLSVSTFSIKVLNSNACSRVNKCCASVSVCNN